MSTEIHGVAVLFHAAKSLCHAFPAWRIPPPLKRYQRPHALYQTKRPRALHEAIRRTQKAGRRKSQHKPMTAIFQSIGDQHHGHRKKTI